MNRTLQLLTLAAITFVSANTATAQDFQSIALYDCTYEVWAADPEPQIYYYIDVLYEDGTGETLGPFVDYNSATWTLWFRTEHNTWPKPVADVDIYTQDIGPLFMFIAEFDTQAEAQDMAATLQSVGLLTEIRPKCTPRFFASRYATLVNDLQPVAGLTVSRNTNLKIAKRR